MAARPEQQTPHLRVAFELMADGEWHDRDAVVMEMGKAIPPGQAVRFVEQQRLLKREQAKKMGLKVKETDKRVKDRSSWFLVTSGRRAIAMKALASARRVEKERRENGKVFIRLRPPMPDRHHPRRSGDNHTPQPDAADQA